MDPGAVKSKVWRGQRLFERPPLSWVINACYAPNWDGAGPVVHAIVTPFVDNSRGLVKGDRRPPDLRARLIVFIRSQIELGSCI